MQSSEAGTPQVQRAVLIALWLALGLGFRVQGLGFKVWGLGFKV